MTQSTFDYPHHFNNHVIDWYLWQVLRPRWYISRYPLLDSGLRFSADDWTRYDGELL